MFKLFDHMSGFFQNMSIDGEQEMAKSDIYPGDNEDSTRKPKVKMPQKVSIQSSSFPISY